MLLLKAKETVMEIKRRKNKGKEKERASSKKGEVKEKWGDQQQDIKELIYVYKIKKNRKKN